MGVWGTGNFDNDTALDWVFELEETNDLSLIVETIEAVFIEDYIDSDVGAEALIAIEAIVRLKGNFGVENSYAEDLDNWVKSHSLEVSSELIEKSKKALELIVSDKSELYELWGETEDFEAWKNEINDLRVRLNQ
jgi:hypothetical protein